MTTSILAFRLLWVARRLEDYVKIRVSVVKGQQADTRDAGVKRKVWAMSVNLA